MTWKADLRAHDGRLSERLLTKEPADAEAHFRRLLAHDDLAGQPIAARLVSSITGTAIYFSRFDRDIGDGRIHPDAPLDLFRQGDGTQEATLWLPPHRVPHDWEADPRQLAECLKEWHGLPGWSRQRAADELRVPMSTYNGWCAGRVAEMERLIRRAMTLIR
jgi:hypothetical protein